MWKERFIIAQCFWKLTEHRILHVERLRALEGSHKRKLLNNLSRRKPEGLAMADSSGRCFRVDGAKPIATVKQSYQVTYNFMGQKRSFGCPPMFGQWPEVKRWRTTQSISNKHGGVFDVGCVADSRCVVRLPSFLHENCLRRRHGEKTRAGTYQLANKTSGTNANLYLGNWKRHNLPVQKLIKPSSRRIVVLSMAVTSV